MTGLELSESIGKSAELIVTLGKDSIRVPVTIVDCRKVFGRIDYQVRFDSSGICGQLAWGSELQVRINKGAS